MKTVSEMYNELAAIEAEMKTKAESGDKDSALVLQGRYEEKFEEIRNRQFEEDSMRTAPAPRPKSMGERILGPRDAFAGLEFGWRNEGEEPVADPEPAADPEPTYDPILSLPGVTLYETGLPAKDPNLLLRFADTLPSAPTSSRSISFKQRATQTGEVAEWDGVDEHGESATKAKVLYTWTDVVANVKTFAGYVPVSKPTLKDYETLLNIIEQDLTLDLREAFAADIADDILATTGITEFDTPMGGAYWEAIRMMKTEVMQTARRMPTHVAMSPEIKQAIDLYKTTEGYYQPLNTFWGLTPVEDENIDGIIVYDANAALKRPYGGLTVEVGYYNDQFIKNELSILAEYEMALQVKVPAAFCFASKTDLDTEE